MFRTRLILVTGAVCAVLPVLIARGQTQTTPPPGAPAAQGAPTTPPKSTALIVGQVIDGSTGQPIPEAVVTLRPIAAGARGGGAAAAAGLGAAIGEMAGNAAMAEAMAAAMARAAGAGALNREQRLLTGGDGRFVFHSLPPGQFQLSVNLNGYTATLASSGSGLAGLTMAMAGGTGPGATASSSYALKEGEHLSDLKLRLWKYASVTGTVLDDGGEPAVGIVVQAMRRIMAGGRARYMPAGTGRTDDRGVYRVASLLPADYLIVIPQTQLALPAAMMEGLIKIGLSGTGGGVADQSAAMAIAEIMMSGGGSSAGAITSGVRMGGYMVASNGAVPIAGQDGRLSAYQTAFYAGALAPVQASIVTLKSGDERTGADFQLRLTPTVRVSGTLTGPSGPAGNLAVRLVVPGDGIVSDTDFDVATSVTAPDGSFSFFGVPPGQFVLRAQRDFALAAMAAQGLNPQQPPPTGPPPKMQFAMANLTVGDSDIDGVAVTLVEGFTVSGRVEFESQTGRAPPQQGLQTISVMLMPADGRTINILSLGRPNRGNEDGTFQTQAFAPGKYFLNAQGIPPPWQLKSATAGGRDVLDTPLEIRNSDISGLVLTMTDRRAQLTGTIKAAGGQKLAEAVIVLFPAEYRAWVESGMNPRRLRTARASAAGAYTIPNLASGEYLAIAFDRSDEGDLQDPAFIELLAKAATRVTLAIEPRAQDLSITRVRR